MFKWQLKPFTELSTEELYNILRLRSQVFVVEQNCPFVDEDDKDLSSYHVIGTMDGILAAYARILPAGLAYPEVSIGRVTTAAAYRRQGYGRLLMQKALEETQRLFGQAPIRIGAQYYLKPFYESFGFKDVQVHYIEDGIAHLVMLRPATPEYTKSF